MQAVRIAAAAGFAALLFLALVPTSAQADYVCVPGAKVVDRQNRTGTVVRVRASDCYVRLADGSERLYLAWMLAPAGGGGKVEAARAAGPQPGTYHCVAAGGVAGTLQLIVRNGSEYTDRSGKTGKFTYDAASGKIKFQSGAWAGYFGRVFGPDKIGLASRDGGYYGTTCDRK